MENSYPYPRKRWLDKRNPAKNSSTVGGFNSFLNSPVFGEDSIWLISFNWGWFNHRLVMNLEESNHFHGPRQQFAAAVVLQALIDSPVIQVGYKYYGYKYYRKMILYSLYTNNIYIYDIHLYWNIMDSLGLIYHWFSSLSLLVLSLHDVKVPVGWPDLQWKLPGRFRGHHRQPSAVSTDHLWGTSRRRCLLVDTEDELMSEKLSEKEIRFEVLVDVEKKSSILIMKSDFQISKIVNMINMI